MAHRANESLEIVLSIHNIIIIILSAACRIRRRLGNAYNRIDFYIIYHLTAAGGFAVEPGSHRGASNVYNPVCELACLC